jgi:AbrB family looped-hinge helix DNA binding protein
MKAIVSEKGQVTIPKALRDRLGIRPGQVLEFEEDCGTLVGRKADNDFAEMRALYGSLKVPYTTDEMIEMMRGPAEFPD